MVALVVLTALAAVPAERTAAAAPPVVDSLTVSPTTLLPGEEAQVAVAARDPLGRPLAYSFSASAGTVTAVPGTSRALFVAPSEAGTLTLTATVIVIVTVSAIPLGGSAESVSAQATVTVAPGLFKGALDARGLWTTRVTGLSDGRLALVDAGAGTMSVLEPDGVQRWQASGLAQPVAVAESGGLLYVLERSARRIAVFSLAGGRLADLASPASLGNDLVAGPGPLELAVSDTGAGTVWIVSASTGSILRSVGAGTLRLPTGLAAFDGKLAVADTGNARVALLDGQGTLLAERKSDLYLVRPQGVAWDPVGSRLAVADSFTGTVVFMTPDLTVTGTLGGFGQASGQLTNPGDLDFVGGSYLAVPSGASGTVSLFRVSPGQAPSAEILVDATVCGFSGKASVRDAGAGASYGWTVTGATLVSGNGTPAITWTSDGGGDVTIAVAVSRDGYTSRGMIAFAPATSLAAPSAAESGPACPGGAVQLSAGFVKGASYRWTGPNGFSSTEQNPTIDDVSAASAGTYSVALSLGGCTSPATSVTVVVSEAPPAPVLSVPSEAPAGATELVATVATAPSAASAGPGDPLSATSWSWTVEGGTLLSGQGTPRITFSAARRGTVVVSVEATAPSGCRSPRATATVRISTRQSWVVPGVALTPGAAGTSWVTDLTLYNPHSTRPVSLQVAFLDGARAVAPESLAWKSVEVAPGQLLRVVNVLSAVFGLGEPSFGAILVRGDDLPADPVLGGRTYNDQGSRGTFGLSLEAVRVERGLAAGGPATPGRNLLPGLKENGSSRTNLMLVNLTDRPATVEVTLRDASAAPLGLPVTVQLEPYRTVQLSRVLTAAPPLGAGLAGSVDSFLAEVRVVSGDSVYPYATVIDNLSGDPVFVGPSLEPAAANRLGGVVRAGGVAGTVWRSDLVLQNPTGSARRVLLSFSYETDADGFAVRHFTESVVDLAPSQTLMVKDFVRSWLGLAEDDRAAYVNTTLDVSPAPDDPAQDLPVLALSRTYNDQPTGQVGLQVTPVSPVDGLSAGTADAGQRLVLPGLAADGRYRTNVAVYLSSPDGWAAAQASVAVRDGEGTLLRTIQLSLDQESRPTRQLSSAELFGDLPGDRSRFTVSVEGVTGSSPVSAYATCIDQISGDATFQSGQLAGDLR